MKMRTLLLTTLTVTLLVIQACAPVYIPSARHTHQLDKKGEISAAVYSGTNGVDGQAAVAVSDKVGILGAGSFGTNEEEGSPDYHRHSYGELRVEYFRAIGRIGRLELIGGGGLGSATSVDNYVFAGSNQQVEATGKYNKLFL